MDHKDRIPTLHELKLAARVERARALFGPGGYLPAPEIGDVTPAAKGQTIDSEERHAEEVPAPLVRSIAAVEDLADVVGGNEMDAPSRSQEGTAGSPAGEDRLTLMTQRENNIGGAADDGGSSGAASRAAGDRHRRRRVSGTDLGEGGSEMGEKVPSYTGHPVPTEPMPNVSLAKERLHNVNGTSGQVVPAAEVRGAGGAVTTVVLTIVGGRPEGRGFTNLQQMGKVRMCIRNIDRPVTWPQPLRHCPAIGARGSVLCVRLAPRGREEPITGMVVVA